MAENRGARKSPSYAGLKPASKRANSAAKGSSKKADTRCEVRLRQALWHSGAHYRKNVRSLPGNPDIVFPGARLAVFCDGDFWHGKNWSERKARLAHGANASYWVAKIERNRELDREHTAELRSAGWTVLRFWESEIYDDTAEVVQEVVNALKALQLDRSHEKA